MERHDELLDVARSETGLDDFGDDTFREGLEVLVRSLDTEANLNAVGEMVTRGQIVRYLGQRLQIEDWYRRHPEIADTVIESPLIGLGLPRTGSTALSCLLGEDPNARSLRRWESSEPCPPPSTVEPPDPRLVRALEEEEQQRQSGSAGLVPGGPTSPAECQDMMALTFASQLFLAFARIPSYADWLFDADLTPTYLYERRTLQLLQWGMPSRPWRLKCPNHLLFLPSLDNAFPDARYVMTNRDPTEVLLSVAELYTQVGKNLSDDYDLGYVGRGERAAMVARDEPRAGVPRRGQRRPLLRHRLPRHAARADRSGARPLRVVGRTGHRRVRGQGCGSGGRRTPRTASRGSGPIPRCTASTSTRSASCSPSTARACSRSRDLPTSSVQHVGCPCEDWASGIATANSSGNCRMRTPWGVGTE